MLTVTLEFPHWILNRDSVLSRLYNRLNLIMDEKGNETSLNITFVVFQNVPYFRAGSRAPMRSHSHMFLMPLGSHGYSPSGYDSQR